MLFCFTYPCCQGLTHALLECKTEGAVAAVAALAGKLFGGEGALSCERFATKSDEMIYTQIINIGIVGSSLLREILSEIEAVCAYSLGKLGYGQVMLQVELCVNAVLLKHEFDVTVNIS